MVLESYSDEAPRQLMIFSDLRFFGLGGIRFVNGHILAVDGGWLAA